jgi:hypothetical protein
MTGGLLIWTKNDNGLLKLEFPFPNKFNPTIPLHYIEGKTLRVGCPSRDDQN